MVRAVEIRRHDIFDPAESTSWFTRLANRLHITTRDGVVRRELLIAPGEPYDSARAAETARNLRALGVFRQVQVDTVRTDSGLTLAVTTRDGWSTRPDFRFRSTGGETEYTFAFIEDNLLGTATQASLKYRKTTDRTSTSLGFLQPRFISRTIRLALEYEDRSDGRRFSSQVGRPFYRIESRSSFLLQVSDRKERVLRFFEGERVASDSLQRRGQLVRLETGLAFHATSRGYLRGGLIAQYRRDDYQAESNPDSMSESETGAAGPYLEWRRARFVLARGFVGFGREEDVDVSTAMRAGVLLAPSALGYDRGGIAPFFAARAGTSLGKGFLFLDLRANGLYDAGGLDSGSVVVGGTMVLQPGARHTMVLHGDVGWIENPLPGEEFDLGLGTGPRAFRSHSFTGDRTFYTTAEYRYTVKEELWKVVGIGLAGFVDYGGAWYDGAARRTGWDAGVGLRLGASRASGVEAIRIDLAHRFANDVEDSGWILVVGKGLTFSTTPGIGNRGQ
jgi:Omp85 superfamily domain